MSTLPYATTGSVYFVFRYPMILQSGSAFQLASYQPSTSDAETNIKVRWTDMEYVPNRLITWCRNLSIAADLHVSVTFWIMPCLSNMRPDVY